MGKYEYRDVAGTKLYQVLSQISPKEEDQSELNQLQFEWENQAQNECEFFYGRVITYPDDTILYEHGTMAPMLVAMCMEEKYDQGAQELVRIYLQDD